MHMKQGLETSGGSAPPCRPAVESSVLFAEANHRIANDLSVIVSLVRLRAAHVGRQAAPMSGPEVRCLLEEIGSRIETVGLLHRLLSREPPRSAVDLGDYLREVCNALASALSPEGRVVLSYAFRPDCRAMPKQVVPLALIVSEAVTNAIKYAHPSGIPVQIDVGCRQHADGTLVIKVSDDGVGLPENFDPMVDGGLGFRVIRSLTGQLGATLEFDSTSLGLDILLVLPPDAGL